MTYWVTDDHLKVIEVETRRERDVFFPGAALLEPDELEDLVGWQVERAEEYFRQPQDRPMTKSEQNQLGGTLMEIKASREYGRENLHGRYWEGSNL